MRAVPKIKSIYLVCVESKLTKMLNNKIDIQFEDKIYNTDMSNYDRILAEFRKLGYNDNSYLQQNEALRALDALSSQNAGFPQFDRSIAQQLWTHCQPDPTRGVKLRDYINTIIQAENILREQAGITEGALKMENRPKQKAELQDQFNQIINDHRIISKPFGISPLKQYSALETSSLMQNKNPTAFNERQGDSVIFAYQPNLREESSTDLKICMFIAIFMFLWEMIQMFHKHHFLNLLCIFGVLSIFFLNYFDKNYMKFLLILLAASLVLDIVWLGVHARQYWSPQPETQHSTLHSGFLAFIFIMTIILMVLKIVVLGILFKYRDNGQSFKKNVSAFGYKIKLDGRPTYNPFTPLLRAAPYNGLI